MVERSDRAPLLDWEEVPPPEKPEEAGDDREKPPASPSSSRALGCSAPGFGWSTSPGGPKSVCIDTGGGGSALPATSITPAAPDAPLCPDADDPPSDSTPEELSLESRMVKWEEKDQIVSVFVVTFNTRSGEAGIQKTPLY